MSFNTVDNTPPREPIVSAEHFESFVEAARVVVNNQGLPASSVVSIAAALVFMHAAGGIEDRLCEIRDRRTEQL